MIFIFFFILVLDFPSRVLSFKNSDKKADLKTDLDNDSSYWPDHIMLKILLILKKTFENV